MSRSIETHSNKEILEGCIALLRELAGHFGEYLEFVDYTPECEEEKGPFCMSYFHIVNMLFLRNTSNAGGTSTMKMCERLGIEDSSKLVEFNFLENDDG